MHTISQVRLNNLDVVERIEEIFMDGDYDSIRQAVAKYFIPTAEERHGAAEVPTPPSLVDEMLSKIPEEFWKTPNTVLEPCCGKGNFVLAVFQKFDNGLKYMFPDTTTRHRCIVEDCIHFTDISALNVMITRELLRCASGGVAKLYNSRQGDTLHMKWDEPFGAVVGNPPYNSNGTLGTGNTIWQKFTTSALTSWTTDNGYVCFVHPPMWRKPESARSKSQGLFKLMAHDNHMEYLEMHDIKDGMKVFGAGTRYDWYVIHRGAQGLTEIDGVEYDLKNFKFLPNSGVQELTPLLGSGCGVMYSRTWYGADKSHVSTEQGGEFVYPLIHSTPKGGVRYRYSIMNDKGFFGVPKVIFGDSGIYDPVVDLEGQYGMTQHSMAIPVDGPEDAQQLVEFLTSEKFKSILNSCMWSNFQIDWSLFTYFRPGFWRV